MVKGAIERSRKYGAKIDADVIRSRISALKDVMEENATVRQSEIATIQADVKAKLNELEVPPEFTVPFMRMALKLYGLTLKHSGKMLEIEAQAYINAQSTKLYAFIKSGTLVQEFLNWLVAYFGLTGVIVPAPPAGG